ncbi:hypothetical protein BD410DRAFT_794052 [Rickenella mellea]|uniref:Uncharacterized protein n=1 Tax=Rickenella mellea TaxID=50990 RepID=A0A4Y7PQN4_9AGAM|nr:hypothetical protein BD410DRAFT_794052 [Rickenella mellea]
MPARHPADRDPTPAPSASAVPSSSSSSTSSSTSSSVTTTPATSADGSSMRKSGSGAGFFFTLFRKPRKDIKVGGMRLTLLLRFVLQVSFIAGTIAAWVIIIKHLMSPAANPVLPIPLSNDPNTNDNGDGQDNNNNGPMAGSTSAIFVHVAFGVSTLAQLLFLERCIFQLRAQRYCHLHPGSMLPSHSRSRSRMSGGGPAMGFAPWNRPPLPTYAAALAQSGYGTGDVEDAQIAIPPPPAYGNTRGSTLLLAGFLRSSVGNGGGRNGNGGSGGGVRNSGGGMEERGRPVSYRSTDEEWEERCDAERALRLEQTLARLEDSASASVTRPKPAAR